MSRRAVAIVAFSALLAAAFAGAYAIAAAAAPDRDDAERVAAEGMRRTYAVAQLGAYADGLRYGLEQGVADGRYDGEQRGRAAGRAAVDTVLAKRNMPTGPPSPAIGTRLEGSGGVLVVGDSLEVGTSPYLDDHLPGVPLTVNAEGGYNSIQIFDLFQDSYDPAQSVIVFDAGTNDNPAYPEILASNLDKVAGIVGDRCLVVPTIHAPPVNGIDTTGKNRVVRSFAASHPSTEVPDWARAAAAHPELMQPDDLHPTPEGADYRAQLIARGVKACLARDPRFIGG
ncbi:MAG: hypothetical protein EDQ89_11250 [Acidobacteria bacterium]|nr:MAG: hypothetical protein EDQ89_11250 [Acidobacteriota bacterium]MCL4287494.1 hypothetical protein [Thermoleophilia bacterium]